MLPEASWGARPGASAARSRISPGFGRYEASVPRKLEIRRFFLTLTNEGFPHLARVLGRRWPGTARPGWDVGRARTWVRAQSRARLLRKSADVCAPGAGCASRVFASLLASTGNRGGGAGRGRGSREFYRLGRNSEKVPCAAPSPGLRRAAALGDSLGGEDPACTNGQTAALSRKRLGRSPASDFFLLCSARPHVRERPVSAWPSASLLVGS